MYAPPSRTSAGPSELLERSHHLSVLGESLVAVRSTLRGRLVLIAGEAGVGKTALMRRFCDEHHGSVRILWGACDALFTPRPLGPLLDIAEAVGGELEGLALHGAQPHEVARALLRELDQPAPTVVVLEDNHWADEATLDVLRLVSRRVEAVPALIVASYRDDALELAAPLRIVLGELATECAIGRLGLAPLSSAAVAMLAEPHGIDAEELYRTTGGNPSSVRAPGRLERPVPGTFGDTPRKRDEPSVVNSTPTSDEQPQPLPDPPDLRTEATRDRDPPPG